MEYVTPKQAKKIYNVSDITLRRWEDNGKIKSIRTEGGHRRYIIHKKPKPNQPRRKIIYARVSSQKQNTDLQKQRRLLEERYPGYEVITDIGSGINFKRKGFNTILDQLFEHNIEEVVVASNDRFSRFGFEFFQSMFTKFNATLTSLDSKQVKSFEQELSQDLIAIVTVFSAKYHGKRKYNLHAKDQDISI